MPDLWEQSEKRNVPVRKITRYLRSPESDSYCSDLHAPSEQEKVLSLKCDPVSISQGKKELVVTINDHEVYFSTDGEVNAEDLRVGKKRCRKCPKLSTHQYIIQPTDPEKMLYFDKEKQEWEELDCYNNQAKFFPNAVAHSPPLLIIRVCVKKSTLSVTKEAMKPPGITVSFLAILSMIGRTSRYSLTAHQVNIEMMKSTTVKMNHTFLLEQLTSNRKILPCSKISPIHGQDSQETKLASQQLNTTRRALAVELCKVHTHVKLSPKAQTDVKQILSATEVSAGIDYASLEETFPHCIYLANEGHHHIVVYLQPGKLGSGMDLVLGGDREKEKQKSSENCLNEEQWLIALVIHNFHRQAIKLCEQSETIFKGQGKVKESMKSIPAINQPLPHGDQFTEDHFSEFLCDAYGWVNDILQSSEKKPGSLKEDLSPKMTDGIFPDKMMISGGADGCDYPQNDEKPVGKKYTCASVYINFVSVTTFQQSLIFNCFNFCMELEIICMGEESIYFPEYNRNDGSVEAKAYNIAEPGQVKLLQPPGLARNNEANEQWRLRSLQRRENLRFSAEEFARAGFYLSPDEFLECFSCQSRHHLEDIVARNPADRRWHHTSCMHNWNTRNTQGRLRQVEADQPGRVSDDIGDPPGQQSVYIPPGDVRKETYRLSTFEHFPVACPISRKSLAKSGFYFTGFFDRVKCFACGRTVQRWEATDNPAELRWHKPDCPFPRGDPCGNIPAANLFSRLPASVSGSQEEVLQQTDPNTGAVVRTVRYPADLPERIRSAGGTFQIGPGNSVIIQSGSRSHPNPTLHIGNEAAPLPPRRWRMANVVSADHRRFLSNLYLNRELDRLTSFARWPVSRPNVSPAALAKSGFFYLGDMDRTQCFSCGGVLRNWTLEDDAQEEHRTHFPRCHLIQGTENRNVPVPQEPESAEDRMRIYPCLYPASPHMRSEAARLETFGNRWPVGQIAATPAVIASAGFFFLGERDRVKCWYCNGGLQNWEYDDKPWTEHAKWFPNCQFLLQKKAQTFIYHHLAMNPHLARPIIAKQEGSLVDPEPGPGDIARGGDVPPSAVRVRQPSPPPIIVDPQEEMRKKKQRIENIIKNSEVCKNVIAMGFSAQVVRQLLEERIDAGNEANPQDIYESTSALLDAVMEKETEMQRRSEEENNQDANMVSSLSSAYSTNVSSIGSSVGPAPGSGRYNVSYYGDEDEPMDHELYGSMEGPASRASVSSVTTAKQLQQRGETSESLQAQLNQIEEERMCKICFTNTADMVFLPCSHMCCCMECTQAIRQCPVCRTKIEKAIKTYVS